MIHGEKWRQEDNDDPWTEEVSWCCQGESAVPARMAIMPFQKVEMEKVMPIHSEGKPWRSECS